MGYQERKFLFNEVIQERKHPLITYITSLRPGINSQMASDSIRPFIDQLELIPKEEKKY